MIAPHRVWALAAVLAGCQAPDPTWDELDHDARVAYMTDVVQPMMRDIFVAHDPERYAGFSCANCHGPDPEATDYAMPAFLGPLPLEGTLEAAEARDPAMTLFMLEDVFGTFTELIDREKFAHDAAPDGFRCTGCHLVQN